MSFNPAVGPHFKDVLSYRVFKMWKNRSSYYREGQRDTVGPVKLGLNPALPRKFNLSKHTFSGRA